MINTEGFFKNIYKNARENSVIVMDHTGYIIQASRSFTSAFGYKNNDLVGKHFRMLFTEEDRKIKKPEKEVILANADGSKSDNNYLLHKDGTPIWVMGESIAVTNTSNEKYLVKIIHNIHAQKQLERFLLESTAFVDTIFDSIKDTSLIILDSALKIVKTNRAFLKMFQLKSSPLEGSRLSQLDGSFWKSPDIKKQLLEIIVNRKPLKKEFTFKQKGRKEKTISIESKLMDGDGNEKKILLVIKEIPQPLP